MSGGVTKGQDVLEEDLPFLFVSDSEVVSAEDDERLLILGDTFIQVVVARVLGRWEKLLFS